MPVMVVEVVPAALVVALAVAVAEGQQSANKDNN